jgi:hypothetical protein
MWVIFLLELALKTLELALKIPELALKTPTLFMAVSQHPLLPMSQHRGAEVSRGHSFLQHR